MQLTVIGVNMYNNVSGMEQEVKYMYVLYVYMYVFDHNYTIWPLVWSKVCRYYFKV